MGYSISSRFRSTILGAAIGEIIGRSGKYNQDDSQIVDLIVLGVRTLIKTGRFDVEEWRNAFLGESISPGHAIVTILPIALFYHENEIKLRQNVQLALLAIGQEQPESRDGALAVGYVVAKSLQTKLNSAELISQTIAFLGDPQTQIAQKLNQVRTLLEQNAGLERTISVLGKLNEPSSQIALALYCFLSTLEEFHISTKRAARGSPQPQITSAITAALSGAYNSIAGIPVTLQMLLGSDNKSVEEGIITTAEMLRLSDALVAVWSGVYEQTHSQTELIRIAAIAAPRVMRSR